MTSSLFNNSLQKVKDSFRKLYHQYRENHSFWKSLKLKEIKVLAGDYRPSEDARYRISWINMLRGEITPRISSVKVERNIFSQLLDFISYFIHLAPQPLQDFYQGFRPSHPDKEERDLQPLFDLVT